MAPLALEVHPRVARQEPAEPFLAEGVQREVPPALRPVEAEAALRAASARPAAPAELEAARVAPAAAALVAAALALLAERVGRPAARGAAPLAVVRRLRTRCAAMVAALRRARSVAQVRDTHAPVRHRSAAEAGTAVTPMASVAGAAATPGAV